MEKSWQGYAMVGNGFKLNNNTEVVLERVVLCDLQREIPQGALVW